MKYALICVGMAAAFAAAPAIAAPGSASETTPATSPAIEPPPAPASPAAKAAKPRAAAKSKRRAPSAILVENKRTATLKSLQIAMPGDKGKVVGKLAKEVPAGKNGRVALKGAKGCEYQVKWEFEDAGDESTADLCNDPKIVLTD